MEWLCSFFSFLSPPAIEPRNDTLALLLLLCSFAALEMSMAPPPPPLAGANPPKDPPPTTEAAAAAAAEPLVLLISPPAPPGRWCWQFGGGGWERDSMLRDWRDKKVSESENI